MGIGGQVSSERISSVLGARLMIRQMPTLQDKVMNLMKRKYQNKTTGYKGNIHPDVVNYVYDNTTPDSVLRKAVRDISAWGMNPDKVSEHVADFRREFLEDLAKVQSRRAADLLGSGPLPLIASTNLYLVAGSNGKEQAASDGMNQANDNEDFRENDAARAFSDERRKIAVRKSPNRIGTTR
jgi:hypothetical protein